MNLSVRRKRIGEWDNSAQQWQRKGPLWITNLPESYKTHGICLSLGLCMVTLLWKEK